MKYYYGNTYKEAINNAPADIQTTEQLQQYESCYAVIFPVETVLPDVVEIEIDGCLADNINDPAWMSQYINDYLSDKYGSCIQNYTWDVVDDKIVVTNIFWDKEC